MYVSFWAACQIAIVLFVFEPSTLTAEEVSMNRLFVPTKFDSARDLHDFLSQLKAKYGHGLTLGFPEDVPKVRQLYFCRVSVNGRNIDHFIVFKEENGKLIKVDDFLHKFEGGSSGVFQAEMSEDGNYILFLGGWLSEFRFKRQIGAGDKGDTPP